MQIDISESGKKNERFNNDILIIGVKNQNEVRVQKVLIGEEMELFIG